MSANLSQKDRIASLKTPLAENLLVLSSFEVDEGLSELFEISIEAYSESDNIDFGKILGEKCAVDYVTKSGDRRYFNGVLAEARWVGTSGRYFLYRMTLRPWIWLMSRRADCRIFKNSKAEAIITEIFAKEGKKDFEFKLSESYQTMDYCVQYRETDLAFVSRLMEQHGIYYFFEHSAGGHKMILTDSKAGHKPVKSKMAPTMPQTGGPGPGADGTYPFLPGGDSNRRHVEYMEDWSSGRRLETGRFALNDYDYKKSTADLKREKEHGVAVAKQYEVFDYPGKYTERSDGERFARIRVEAAQALDGRRVGSGGAPSLYPGALCRVSGIVPSAEDGEYLVIGARHRVSGLGYESGVEGDVTYSGSYEFVRSDTKFRAPCVTPHPRIYGPQTAKVVGENRDEGEEIDVDKDGCIFVQFFWDRGSKTTSRRVRVAQVWAGKGWGGQFIPRIGQEVVVEFLDGDPDQPLVTGAVYNDKHTLPYDLPGNKSQAGIKSNSTKGGNGYNELRFDDLKDSEKVTFHGQKDLASVVRNSETREIGEVFSPPTGSPARKTVIKNGDDKLDVDSGSLFITAKMSIELKCGDSKITMTPVSVTIESPTISVKSKVLLEEKSDGIMTMNATLIKIN